MAYCLIHSSGSHFKAFLYVKATPGATVTATGPKTTSGIADNNGDIMLEIKRKGTYSVTSESSGATTQSVPVLKSRNSYYANVTGAFTLTIDRQSASNTYFASMSVSRSSSPYGPDNTSTGPLTNGATVYYGDVLTATATANTGFKNASVTSSGSITKSGDNYIVGGNCTLRGNAQPISVKLTLKSTEIVSGTTAATASLNRESSPYAGASKGNVTAGNDKLYYGDTFTVASTSAVTSAYTALAPSVSGAGSPATGGIYTVGTSDVTVTANASTKYYTLTITKGDNTSLSVERTESPYQNASKSTYTSSFTVYYGDKVKIIASSSAGYSLTLKWGSNGISSGSTQTISGAATVTSSATKIPYHLNWLTVLRLGQRQYSTSGNWSWHTVDTSPAKTGNNNNGSVVATISGDQLTVYARKLDSASGGSTAGVSGVAMKLSDSKVSLTNGQTITATWSSQSNGTTNYCSNDIYIVYGTSYPGTSTNSPFQNLTLLGESYSKNGSISATFTGATGSYYLGVAMEGDYSGTSFNTSDDLHLGGQITLSSVTVT